MRGKSKGNNHEGERAPTLKSHHEEGNNTSEGSRANELGSRVLSGTGGRGRGGSSTSSSAVSSGGSVSLNDQVTASNTGTVVMDNNRASDHGAVSGLGEGQLGIDVLDGGEGAVSGGDNVSVLASEITNLAGGGVLGVAGNGAVEGVQVSSGGHAAIVGAHGGDVDVVLETGGLVDGDGGGETLETGEGDVHTALDLVEGEVGADVTY